MMIRMKTGWLALIGMILISNLSAQGIEFFHGSWEEALIEAEKQGKPIFVDCYTTWCGPCKRMAKDVFPNEEVGAFYNDNFINVKMDMEKGEGPSFGKKYPVGAYPTLYYIKSNGEVIMAQRGARQVPDFIELGKSALSRIDFSADYRKAYDSGERDPELILNYVKALNRSEGSSLKVVNDFLREEPDLDDSLTRAIILEGTTEADSRPFSLLISNRALFDESFGEEEVKKKIIAACENTAEKAVEFEFYGLVEQAVALMKEHVPDRYQDFRYLAPMRYHQAYSDWPAFYEVAEEYVKKQIRKDPVAQQALSKSVRQHFSYEEASKAFVEELLLNASKLGESWEHDYDLARFYFEEKKYPESKKYNESALKKAKDQNAPISPMESLNLMIEGKENGGALSFPPKK